MNYRRYLASREWAEKKNAVMKRSQGLCERCLDTATQVHHATYERIGDERLTDLLAVCAPCHKFLSARTEVDPAREDEACARRMGLIAWVFEMREAFGENSDVSWAVRMFFSATVASHTGLEEGAMKEGLPELAEAVRTLDAKMRAQWKCL